MNKIKALIKSVLVGFICGLISFLLTQIIMEKIAVKKANIAYKPMLIITTEKHQEQPVNISVMHFTPDEADELLNQFKTDHEEKEKAERKREEERQRELAQHMSFYSPEYSPEYFRRMGVIWWGNWRWTWYSERVLPGGGLRIPGRYTDSLGYVRDEDGYICLASDVLSEGTVIDTPFGSSGKVYDCGCGNDYTVDVYVGW